MLDMIIIGSGPAGLSAAVYARRASLEAVVIEKEYMGTGQIAESSRVDNYLGMPGMDGYSLGEAFREHAEAQGAVFVEGNVTSIANVDGVWTCTLEDGSQYEAKTIVYCAGCKNRNLGVEGEDKYNGRGISYCAVCDGAFYKDRAVAVIGGGDTALDDALYLSDICGQVYLIHRRNEFRGSASTVDKLRAMENVTFVTPARVTAINGGDKLSGIVLDNGDELAVDGLFVAVGMVPQTEVLAGLDEALLDSFGYVNAGEDGKTVLAGLYVAGDARTKQLRQVVTAASDGANAVMSAMEYLKK